MNKNDQQLLEEAYNQIMLSEGMIPSVLKDKIKGVVLILVSRLREESPEEFNRIESAVRSKNVGELKNLFIQYNVEEELHKYFKPVVQEGIIDAARSGLSAFGRFMSGVTDVVLGHRTSTRSLITMFLLIILAVAQLWLLSVGAGSGELADMGLVELLTTTKLGVLTSVLYSFIPFLVTREVQTQKRI